MMDRSCQKAEAPAPPHARATLSPICTINHGVRRRPSHPAPHRPRPPRPRAGHGRQPLQLPRRVYPRRALRLQPLHPTRRHRRPMLQVRRRAGVLAVQLRDRLPLQRGRGRGAKSSARAAEWGACERGRGCVRGRVDGGGVQCRGAADELGGECAVHVPGTVRGDHPVQQVSR